MRKKAQQTLNWYQSLHSQDLEELENLINKGIYIALVKAKTDPALSHHFHDYTLQRIFMSCENAAKKVLDNIKSRSVDAARQMFENLKKGLDMICQRINCSATPYFSQVMQNLENCRIMLQNIHV